MKQKHFHNNKEQQINSSNLANKFSNLRNLFTIRSLLVLAFTMVVSFSFRFLPFSYFDLNLSLLKDFLFTGVLVTIVRPLVTDLLDIFLNNEISISERGDISSSNWWCDDERRVNKHKTEHKDQLRFNRENIGNSGNGNHNNSNRKGNFY